MPRAKRGNKRLERRKKILKLAKGYRGTKSKLYRSEILADLAAKQPDAFAELASQAKTSLENKPQARAAA